MTIFESGNNSSLMGQVLPGHSHETSRYQFMFFFESFVNRKVSICFGCSQGKKTFFCATYAKAK